MLAVTGRGRVGYGATTPAVAGDGDRLVAVTLLEVDEASLRANRRLGHRVEPLWLTWTRPAG